MRAWMITGAGLALICASSVRASDVGPSDSASVTITVNIPPFEAALAAQAEGAVGLWTVGTDGSPLMIKLPDRLSGEGEAAIFTDGAMPVSISGDGRALVVSRGATSTTNGLRRQAFGLRTGTTGNGVATMLVTAT